MAKSRLEINFVLLLSQCEAMASEKREKGEWRLEKFVCALEEMLDSIKKDNRKPAPELLVEYSRKVDFLKGLLEAEKLLIYLRSGLWILDRNHPPGPCTAEADLVQASTAFLVIKNPKKRHFNISTVHCSVVRRGSVSDDKQSAAELDAVLQHHHNLQEKLAEEMLRLNQNLKNNTLAAQKVIKQDNQTLSQSLKLVDHNFEKLKTESDRLEQHAKKSVNWILWIMLIFVCFAFISMILFIRIFPRLR
ncbi:vesicle transport protein USE1 [Xenopus laevis]|uniref:Vesicle transport protein USE1 n=1 Tax=Xenopus laevis TaxID=8355 RepID=A0A8J1LZE4_XENLA|nr:vesicle transport protein USE1 [Xenopus laevis]